MPHPPNVLFIMVDQWPGALLAAPAIPSSRRRRWTTWPAWAPAIRAPTLSVQSASRAAQRDDRHSPRGHGDRNFAPALPMPALPTLAQRFRDGGYQAYAVGKMHLYPQRDRIGFDDILLAEEGRAQLGAVDDYDMYLAEQGAAGEQYLHGMNNNDYLHRPWHLPERLHVTNWTTARPPG